MNTHQEFEQIKEFVNDGMGLFKKPSKFSSPLAKIQKGKVLIVEKCDGVWCQVKTKKFKGWIKIENVWGSIK